MSLPATTKQQHVMAPLVERVAVPMAWITVGVLVGLYLGRKKSA